MAGEIQLNGTSFASESGGTITINNGTVGSSVAMSANQACVKTAINASGLAPIYACRAWVNADGNADGTCTIRGDGNVAGVSEDDTARYTITFDEAMEDVNYCITQCCSRIYNTTGAEEDDNINFNVHQYNTGSCRGYTSYTDTKVKALSLNIAIFR